MVYYVDNQLGQLYVDGSLEAEGLVYSPGNSSWGDLFFGKDGLTGHFYLDGILDDIRIYGKRLTPSEIADIIEYNPLSPTEEKNPDACAVKVFPNPGAQGWVQIEWSGCEIQSVRIVGLDGKLLWEGPFAEKIDLTSFPEGMLFFEFFDPYGKQVGVEKVVISKE